MLHGANAETAYNAISLTMTHLTTALNDTSFQYSYEFVNLLVSQMDDALEEPSSGCK